MVAMHSPIQTDAEIMGGRPCFAGTRVPVRTLFDYLAGGESLDRMLEQFPSVRREDAVAVLELAADKVGARPLSEPVPRPAKTA
jgi:uncharacterized protein (DUF433 family)